MPPLRLTRLSSTGRVVAGGPRSVAGGRAGPSARPEAPSDATGRAGATTHRLQGDRDDLGVVVDQPGHPQQQLLQRRRVDRLPSRASRRGAAPSGSTGPARPRPGRWPESAGAPCRRAARRRPGEPEGEHGAGRRVDDGPDDGVDPARGHPLHDGRSSSGLAEELGQLGVRPPQLLLVREVEPYAAEVGAVPQVRGGGLEGDGVAEAARRPARRRRGRGGQGALRTWMPYRAEQRRARRARRRGVSRAVVGRREAAPSISRRRPRPRRCPRTRAPGRARPPPAATGRTCTASARARTARSAAG